MKSNEKKLILVLVVITAIVIVIFLVNKNSSNNKVGSIDLETVGIDVTDEAYEGKKIYEENGDIIIENENGSKTIETLNSKTETDLKQATEEEKGKYEITEVNVNVQGNRTTIVGKIKNNTNGDHKVSIGAKFYSEDNRIKGSTSTQIENLKQGETQDFQMVLMGDMIGFTHKVEVEYTN